MMLLESEIDLLKFTFLRTNHFSNNNQSNIPKVYFIPNSRKGLGIDSMGELARDIRIGNASYIYHQQAVPIQENRLIMYYKEWLEGLPPNISRHMRMLGFEACKTMIPFTRYVNERNDIGMRDWMQEHLSPSDFNYWQELSKKAGSPTF